MKDIVATLRPALVSLLAFTGLLGLAYPVLVGAFGRGVPHPAPAALVGRGFTDPAYFWPRPSAAGYDARTSGGTNQGPSHPALAEAVRARIAALRAADPTAAGPVPIDLVTASASGLDPDVSPAAAYYQIGRVARARGLSPDALRRLVDGLVQERTLGILGARRVNVVELNRELDGLGARRTP